MRHTKYNHFSRPQLLTIALFFDIMGIEIAIFCFYGIVLWFFHDVLKNFLLYTFNVSPQQEQDLSFYIFAIFSLFLFFYLLSMHYTVLSTWKLFVRQDTQNILAYYRRFTLIFILGLLFGVIGGILFVLRLTPITFEPPLNASKIMKYYFIINVISLSFACGKIREDISFFRQELQGGFTIDQMVLFLRKFKSKGDYIWPGLLAGAVGDRFQIVALSSKFLKRSLKLLIGSISFIPITKRIFKPFSYVIDFYFTYDEDWEDTVESLIKKADYIVVDISNASENILHEVSMIHENDKVEKTFFAQIVSKEEDSNNKIIKALKRHNIDVDNKVIRYYKFLKRKETVKALREVLIPRGELNAEEILKLESSSYVVRGKRRW